MKLRTCFGLLGTLCLPLFAAEPPQGYESLKAEAEKFYADKSFSKAHEAYARAMEDAGLSGEAAAWVRFRFYDTQWRSAAATESADDTQLQQARSELTKMVRDKSRSEEQDRVWAEVQESLGDWWWTRRHNQNWGQARPFYVRALDWWAGARDIELARERYLSMVWRMALPPRPEPYYRYGYFGNYIDREIVENALKIARSSEDQAHAHYLLALTLQNRGGDAEQRQRVQDEFEGAIRIGSKTDWYDDALFQYAQWLASQGRVVAAQQRASFEPGGNWRVEPDYVRALDVYRRLVKEYAKGETRYWDQAQQAIEEITGPQLNLLVSDFFLPGSEIQYSLSWRNVKQIELALYPIELNRDVQFGSQPLDWLQAIQLGASKPLKAWTRAVEDKGDYRPGTDTVRLEEKLPAGAYLLTGSAGGKTSRQLILVTDAALVLKSSGKQALIYFCDAVSGAPLAHAKVVLRERWNDNRTWQTREQSKETDADGLAVFELQAPRNAGRELFASGQLQERQAFSTGNSWWNDWQNGPPWRIYAFTDRPAYRPKETVNWKFIARQYADGRYSTPAGQTLEYQINDPRGTKVKEGRTPLNSFGSTWGSLELTGDMPLGEYRVQFWDEGRKRHIGDASLFRLEEYKLPEFKVTVATPEEDGRKKAFKLGDAVEVTVQADYYFGGPVANANVEVVVNQKPFWMHWPEPREFPWFYEDMDQSSRGRWWGGQQIVKRETLKTDATGKATLTFETPRGASQDYEYRIEARVTDASRREIVGSGTVRVTRQRYYVKADADHRLYQPQDKVAFEFKAADANQEPVVCEGTVKVTRDYWWEIWVSPEGKEVKGEALRVLRRGAAVWPPPPTRPSEPGWRLKFRGYEHDDILTRMLKTDTNGVARFDFTPEREGYYRVAWSSEDEIARQKMQVANPITAETTVWVCTDKSTELGYRTGGLEIIVDKDTFRVGQKAPVMIQTPGNDRYVLFTVESDDLHSAKLLHLDGTVKLVELDVTEQDVPNIFLNAAMVSDKQLYTDSKQVVVPPTRNFLTVEVKPDRDQYQPREDGTLTVTTRDDQGKPVSAEVALSLVDESVFYIQADYAGDPRQFYFGNKRPQSVQTGSTFNQHRYVKLVRVDDQLLDESQVEDYERRQRQQSWREERQADHAAVDRDGQLDEFSAINAPAGVGGAYLARGAAPMAAAELSQADASREMPAPAAMPRMRMAKGMGGGGGAGGEMEEPAVVVRTDFRSTILWQPEVVTDAAGTATVKVTYPDSLTGWKATARAATAGNQFGIADATTRTRQPLIVRLQAPRFFVVGDTVTLSAVVNNNTDETLSTKVQIEADGLKQVAVASAANQDPLSSWIPQPKVPAGGEARVDWTFKVEKAGAVRIKVSGRSGQYADAMEKSYLAFEHGIEKFVSKSGKVRGDEVTLKLDLPERQAGSTQLAVQVTPSLAVTMLDALPYLIDYPYGCTEQTMSRFLPATIVAKTLKDAGLQPEDVMGRVFGGIETNTASATHPKGRQDLAKLGEMTQAGLDRLYDFQHGDGGWGWWKEGESDHWMTAYVVWGLSLAKEAGVPVKPEAVRRGAEFLAKEMVEEEENRDLQAFMLHALAAYKHAENETGLSALEARAFDNLWKNREQLNAYTRSLLALSAHYFGKTSEARTLIANLENGVKRDERPDTSVLVGGKPSTLNSQPSTVLATAHWGEDGLYWRWSDGGVEATAFALRALLAIDPTNSLVEPVVNWLIKNRRGAQWSNTRDTAIVVLAMTDYLRASGELNPELEYDLYVNQKRVAREKVSGPDVFNAPSRFVIEGALVKDHNEIRIVRKSGKGPIYFAATCRYFSLEEPITPAGNEIFVKRQYFKLVGRPTLLKGYVYDKEPLLDGESVKSGERVETVLTIEGKNNYEYLLFEDLKPAGFEAVEIRSGESLFARELKSGAVDRTQASAGSGPSSAPQGQSTAASRRAVTRPSTLKPQPARAEDSDYTGRQRWVYQELRDRKVALFIDKLPQGVWEIRYDLRAEVPGAFHALPVLGHAMYVPEIRCNGAELRVKVEDAQ